MKNPNKTQLGWVFFKKPGFFPALSLRPIKCGIGCERLQKTSGVKAKHKNLAVKERTPYTDKDRIIQK